MVNCNRDHSRKPTSLPLTQPRNDVEERVCRMGYAIILVRSCSQKTTSGTSDNRLFFEVYRETRAVTLFRCASYFPILGRHRIFPVLLTALERVPTWYNNCRTSNRAATFVNPLALRRPKFFDLDASRENQILPRLAPCNI